MHKSDKLDNTWKTLAYRGNAFEWLTNFADFTWRDNVEGDRMYNL